jgi:hypothetical protein
MALFGTVSSDIHFRNRIINGDMRIDQRNAGASVTQAAIAVYSLDRWGIFGSVTSKFTAQQNAGSVTPPIGFSNYLGITSSAATSVGASDVYDTFQFIEGFNTADLGWGTASAATVTLSFWARSSLTGTFGGAVSNSAYAYSYPFSYTISAANTWEQKTITIAGPTAGTWVGATNGAGLRLYFGLGVGSANSGTAGSWSANGYASATGAVSVVGTSGATFYITGVQLEAGSVASPFERIDYGRQFIMCQRYYEASQSTFYLPASSNYASVTFAVEKRAAPVMTRTGGGSITTGTIGSTIPIVTSSMFYFTNPTNSVVGGNWTASAEL